MKDKPIVKIKPIVKAKPVADDGCYAAKCHWCKGTGMEALWWLDNPEDLMPTFYCRENTVCDLCNGMGWKMRKIPKKVEHGNMERPI